MRGAVLRVALLGVLRLSDYLEGITVSAMASKDYVAEPDVIAAVTELVEAGHRRGPLRRVGLRWVRLTAVGLQGGPVIVMVPLIVFVLLCAGRSVL